MDTLKTEIRTYLKENTLATQAVHRSLRWILQHIKKIYIDNTWIIKRWSQTKLVCVSLRRGTETDAQDVLKVRAAVSRRCLVLTDVTLSIDNDITAVIGQSFKLSLQSTCLQMTTGD